MDPLLWMLLIATGAYVLKSAQQSRRIALLASHLGKYQIEKQLQTVTEGLLRGLAENEPARRQQVWDLLVPVEVALSQQFMKFAADFARIEAPLVRISRLPMALPFAERLPPPATFDARLAFALHGRGIAAAVENPSQRTPKERAFTLMAEVLLMQHTCHWFCRSRNVATMRMLARHQTSYEQLIAGVAPETRQAYLALVGG